MRNTKVFLAFTSMQLVGVIRKSWLELRQVRFHRKRVADSRNYEDIVLQLGAVLCQKLDIRTQA